jgi:hypothetical protein
MVHAFGFYGSINFSTFLLISGFRGHAGVTRYHDLS